MHIRVDDLRGPEIAALLATHVAFCRASSPPESTHVLDLDALRAPGITFWSAWDGASLLGCSALKELDPTHGEVKSMHTAARHRGRGVGLALLRRPNRVDAPPPLNSIASSAAMTPHFCVAPKRPQPRPSRRHSFA